GSAGNQNEHGPLYPQTMAARKTDRPVDEASAYNSDAGPAGVGFGPASLEPIGGKLQSHSHAEEFVTAHLSGFSGWRRYGCPCATSCSYLRCWPHLLRRPSQRTTSRRLALAMAGRGPPLRRARPARDRTQAARTQSRTTDRRMARGIPPMPPAIM